MQTVKFFRIAGITWFESKGPMQVTTAIKTQMIAYQTSMYFNFERLILHYLLTKTLS